MKILKLSLVVVCMSIFLSLNTYSALSPMSRVDGWISAWNLKEVEIRTRSGRFVRIPRATFSKRFQFKQWSAVMVDVPWQEVKLSARKIAKIDITKNNIKRALAHNKKKRNKKGFRHPSSLVNASEDQPSFISKTLEP